MKGLIIYIAITQLFFCANFFFHFKYNKKFNIGQRDFLKKNSFYIILLAYLGAFAATPFVWPYMLYVSYEKYPVYKCKNSDEKDFFVETF